MIVSAFADEAGESVIRQMEALKRNGLKYIDVRAIDGKNVAEMSLVECERYRAVFDDNGIKVNCLASPIGKVDISVDFVSYMKLFEEILEKARIFGTDKIRIFSFYHSKGRCVEVVYRLQTMVERAQRRDILLYHENELGIYGERVADVLALKKNVQGLKFLYDPANFVLVGQEIGSAEDLLLSDCEFFHIKDATYDGKIVPAGEGDGDIVGAHKKAKVKFATLEPHLTEFDGYGSIDQRKIKSRYVFADGDEAFDYGVSAYKKILKEVDQNG